MNNSKKLYYCYSLPQSKFLYSKGIEYELVVINKNTMFTMWIYIKTKEYNKALIEWSQGNK